MTASIASLIETAFAPLAPRVRVTAVAVDGHVELTIHVHDARGAFYEGRSANFLIEALPTRVERYARALARHADTLVDLDELVEFLSPEQLFLRSLLAEDHSQAEIEAILGDPGRMDRALRAHHVMGMVAGPFDGSLLDSLYALTADGRASLEWPEVASALRDLLARGEDGLVVEAMEDWVEDDGDWDGVWEGGPSGSTLLLAGAWRRLDPRLTGELRRRALRAVDRIADESVPTAAELDRAGL